MKNTTTSIHKELEIVQNAMQRLLAEIPQMMQKKAAGEKPVCDEATRLAIQDVANFIRKDVFAERKVDKTQSAFGIIAGAMAFIASMTAILAPMNNSINDIKSQSEKSSAALLTRIERLEAGEAIDKNLNGKIDVMYDVLMKGKTP